MKTLYVVYIHKDVWNACKPELHTYINISTLAQYKRITIILDKSYDKLLSLADFALIKRESEWRNIHNRVCGEIFDFSTLKDFEEVHGIK